MREKHQVAGLACFLYLEKNGKVLLLRRANTGYMDGQYSLVAGRVDEGETFTEGIIHEALEEASIMIEKESLRVVHVLHRHDVDADKEYWVDTFLTTDKWQGEIKNGEPDKCDDLSWFDVDNLPENMIDSVRYALEKIRQGEVYSEYGW